MGKTIFVNKTRVNTMSNAIQPLTFQINEILNRIDRIH